MLKKILLSLSILLFFLLPTISVEAQNRSLKGANRQLSAEDGNTLIAEINALRESTGKFQYEISPILMQTAQAQAEYMASIGLITHLGPGGITTTNRLLAAGYPLAGDLSLGGIRSENIGGGPGMTVIEVVNAWKGDDMHYNTMTSPNNTQIGAGIATSGEDVYFVIDCARNIGAKTPYLTNTPAPTIEGDNSGPNEGTDNSGYVNLPGEGPLASSLFTATPDSGGKLYHKVKSGETLWLIAISYGVKIAEIRHLNNLSEANSIYPNEKLLIREGVFITPVPPTPSKTQPATPTIEPTQPLSPS
ncbi:MAG: CAP domain-containing protein, partial [Chloroflexota bacterium]